MINYQTNNKSKNELINQRSKFVASCINLECQNEQLKVLIDKLHKMACERENLISGTTIRCLSFEFDYLKNNKSRIVKELNHAQDNSSNLETRIKSLKSKIVQISEMISNQ